MSISLLALFRRKFNGQARLTKILSDNSFAAYVFHAPVLIAISLLLQPLAWPPRQNSGWSPSWPSPPPGGYLLSGGLIIIKCLSIYYRIFLWKENLLDGQLEQRGDLEG